MAFFGIEVIGIMAVYVVCRYISKRSIWVSKLLAAISSIIFALLCLLILGTLNRL